MTTSAPETTASVTSEGSVKTADGKFIEYPDGFKITFVKAETRPDSKPAFDGDPNTKDRVRVTLLLENQGPTPVTIAADLNVMKAYGGINRFDLNLDPGYAGEDESRNAKPNRLSPGTSLQVYETFNIPASQRDAIAISVNDFSTFAPADGGAYTPYTFTDIEDVLEQ